MIGLRTRVQRTKKGKRGQGTIELILTFFAFFTIFFMYVQVSMTFAVANYIHYATFMAARAFLAGYPSLSDQKSAAASYLTKMVGTGKGRFASIVEPTGGGGEVDGATIGPTSRVKLAPDEQARATAWEQGVTYSFKARLYLAPLIPGINRGDDSKVKLESQSWLGREPTGQECEKYLQQKGQQIGGLALFDNGC